MAASVDLVIRVITDTKKASADMQSVGKDAGGFAAGVKKAAVPAAIALAAVAAGAVSAANSASKTEQAMGGIDSVFGKSAEQVKKWSDQAAESAGLAKSQYGELATVIGSQLKNSGMPMKEVATNTNALIQKGADLAAMFGGTTADAVSALSSVLKGETDPIEAYGVSIKQADIAAQMAADGTDKLTGKAQKQAQAMAALELVNKQTADSTGKFASESDTAAGSSQIMQAKLENMKSQMGTALLPVMAALASVMARVFGFMSKHTTTFQILAAVIAAVAAAILVLNVALSVMAIAEAVALGPILLIVLAVAALIVVIILVVKHFDTLKKIGLAAWNAIKNVAVAAWNGIKRVVVGAFTAIRSAIASALSWIKGNWATILAILTGPIGVAVLVIARNWDKIKSGFESVKNRISTIAGALLGIITKPFDAAKTAVHDVSSAVSAMIGWIKKVVPPAAFSGPFDIAKSAVNAVIDAVKSLIGWLGKIHVPKISLPHIPGTGRAATATAVPSTAGYAAPRGVGLAPGVRSSTGTGAVVVNVTGALDPEAVARQIRRILDGHNRRVGLAS